MSKVKGRCSICKGRVIEHDAVGSMPARVQCENCQALEAGTEHVIEMVPPRAVPFVPAPVYAPWPQWIGPVNDWPWWKKGEVICQSGSDIKVTVGDAPPCSTQTSGYLAINGEPGAGFFGGNSWPGAKS